MIHLSGPSLAQVERTSELYESLREYHRKVAEKDPTTWGESARDEARIRLNWVDLPTTSRDLLITLDALAAKFRSYDHIILCAMGGSSLAPEVIAKSHKKTIFILDSTDPQYMAHSLNSPLASTLVIVSSKSGSTIETTSQRAFFEEQFTQAGLRPQDHMVIVTDPGSPLDLSSRSAGFTVVNADPHVGGRFSALSAFGLVPSALLGIDSSILLDEASDCKQYFLNNPENILDVAYLLITQTDQYVGFTDEGSSFIGLSDWIEQLIAESTGKDGRGRLPIVAESAESAKMGNVFTVAFASSADLVVKGELGEHFIFWEWVTALLGAALGVDPFNQPNVTEAKEQTSMLLASWNNSLPRALPDSQEDNVQIFGVGNTLRGALKNLIAMTDSLGYISIMAYLDRVDDEKILELRSILSEAAQRPVTFGWGPRYLHSTGQFHKGGQPNGTFLQITGDSDVNFQVPGKEYDFYTLLMAQALGDGLALSKRKYPLLHLHLQNRSVGINQLLEVAKSL